jgi:hypothetical protein
MTCILEWGSTLTTPSGVQSLQKTLNFKNVEEAKLSVYLSQRQSREAFIQQWCQPNKFNYDWAVAEIANIKTRLENNIYKTTVIAYGRADNLMYMSAYATNNPLTEDAFIQGQNVAKSVQDYFKPNGRFSILLRNIIATPDAFPDFKNKVFRFNDPIERKNINQLVPTGQQFGTVNDVGLEDAYFISFEALVDSFFNRDVLAIVNAGLSTNSKLNKLIAPLRSGESDIIYAGYNKYLRSTSPDVMIIYNKQAVDIAAAEGNTDTIRNTLLDTIDRSPTGSVIQSIRDRLSFTPNADSSRITNSSFLGDKISQVQTYITNKPYGGSTTAVESDVVPLYEGVWINSKAVQQAFINARTVFEGMEALLSRINAATENYWDLSLFYDDDIPGFRILDANARKPDIKEKIYEFNKPLNSLDNTVIGPDVLDIKIETDYPKLLFSQLAISGINNGVIASDPQRKDIDFRRGVSVTDMFKNDPITPPPPSATPVATTGAAAAQTSTVAENLARVINNIASPRLAKIDQPLAGDTNTKFREEAVQAEIATGLNAQFGSEIPRSVTDFLVKVFSVRDLLDVNTARQYQSELNTIASQEKLTSEKILKIKELLLLRSRQIIIAKKRKEIDNLSDAYENLKTVTGAENIIGVRVEYNNSSRLIVSDEPLKQLVNRIKEDGNRLIRELYASAGVPLPTYIASPQGLGTITLNVTV